MSSTRCVPHPEVGVRHRPVAQLDATARALKVNHVAPSTRATYNSALRVFRTFCTDCHLVHLPASSSTILHCLAQLFHNGLSYGTARVYLAAVSNLHSEAIYVNPADSADVTQALTGFKRLAGVSHDSRLPITLDIMRLLKTNIYSSFLSGYDKDLFWSASTLAFFAFIRVGEFTTPHTNASVIRLSDVSCSTSNRRLVLGVPKMIRI